MRRKINILFVLIVFVAMTKKINVCAFTLGEPVVTSDTRNMTETYSMPLSITSEGMGANETRQIYEEFDIDLRYANSIRTVVSRSGRSCCYMNEGKVEEEVAIYVNGAQNLSNIFMCQLNPDLWGNGTAHVTVVGRLTTPNPCSNCGGFEKRKIDYSSLIISRYKPLALKGGPESVTVNSSESAVYTVSAKYTDRYKWQAGKDGSYYDLVDGIASDGTVFSGCDTPSLSIVNISEARNGETYRCVLIGERGFETYSNEASLNVNPAIIEDVLPTKVPEDIINPTPSPTNEPIDTEINPMPEDVTNLDPNPTKEPTAIPTVEPTAIPTKEPTKNPTKEPEKEPTLVPTKEPIVSPTAQPTIVPTREPIPSHNDETSTNPSKEPSVIPTKAPNNTPIDIKPIPTEEPAKDNLYPTQAPIKIPKEPQSSEAIKPITTSSSYVRTPTPNVSGTPGINSSSSVTSSSARTEQIESKNIYEDIPEDLIDTVSTTSSTDKKSGVSNSGSRRPNSSSVGKEKEDSADRKFAGSDYSHTIISNTAKTTMKDGILYLIDNEDEEESYKFEEIETEVVEEYELENEYSAGDLIDGNESYTTVNVQKKYGIGLYIGIIFGAILLLVMLLFVLFFGVIVEGECEESDDVFDICRVTLLGRKDGNWYINLKESFEDNAVLRLRLGLLFVVIFKDTELMCKVTGNYEGDINGIIERKMLLYRKSVRRIIS